MTTEWPEVRLGWTGHRPQIFGNHSTADIFRLACRPGGATIKEMLRLRRDTGNADDKKEAALKKLIKEIEKAYLVELIVNGDNYRFQRVNSNVSSPNKTPQQIDNQPQSSSHLPAQADIEFAESQLRKSPDEVIDIEAVFDQVEAKASSKNKLNKLVDI